MPKTSEQMIDRVRRMADDSGHLPNIAALRYVLEQAESARQLAEALERYQYLGQAAVRFIRTNDLEEHTETWDEAECDGNCLCEDLENAAEHPALAAWKARAGQ